MGSVCQRRVNLTMPPVMSRFQPVSSQSEQVLNQTVNREESLSLRRRLELPHLVFPLSGRLV